MPARKNLHKVKRKILVSDAKQAWKWLSVQILALIAGAQGLLIFVPTLKDYIPANVWHGVMSALAVLAIVGRIINQAPK